jgi:hypothetical protein
MTGRFDVDRLLEDWFAEGPSQLSGQAIDRIVDRVEETPQRKHGWLPGREAMNRMFALGSAALVMVAAVLALAIYVNNPGGGFGGPPAPTPTPTAEPSSTPVGQLPEGNFDFADRGTAMTVTIPASGWTFAREFTALVKGNEVANLPEATVLFWSFPAGTGFYVYGNPCQMTSTKPDTPVTTVDDFAAALAAQASREASEPVDVTVGGYAGKSIILHVPDDAVFDECEGGEFASYGTEEDPLTRYHQGPGQIDELWILDVDGPIVVIDATYRPDTPAELIAEMRAIAESTTFE